MFTVRLYLLFFLSLVLTQCRQKPSTLFELLPATETGIDFVNAIQETDSLNILTFEYIYNGGGVAIADYNNDGYQDVFFSGNQVPNRMYLNRGEWKFEDVTEQASINIKGRWNTGIAVADINGDGLQDIYVCASMAPDSANRANMLFINKGINAAGIPVFEDQAEAYGVADTGHSMSAVFFDYDRDGDLDLYVLTNQLLKGSPTSFRPKMLDGSSPNTDRLYRNNGNGSFTNVSREAGILIEGLGLGVSVADVNEDDWPDLYVSNDFLSNDILYVNQKDGTFKNEIRQYIAHQSYFSMGNDAADINNDGLIDLITLDMLPETNDRKKSTIGNKTYLTYINNEVYGYEYQYMRNMLHLNNGRSATGKTRLCFSEIGFMSGIHQTEWSWSPLLADFDNDGLKDLLITNGYPKDINDKDFANYRNDISSVVSVSHLIDSIPVVRISNYAYRNSDALQFSDVTRSWGLYEPSFSNGAAFADLDNDGDLDYVVNNINDPAFVYRNNLYHGGRDKDADADTVHYLRVKLVGDKATSTLGTKVWLKAGGKLQYHEHALYRGYLSTIEDYVHFGLGKGERVDSLYIRWPDGKSHLLTAISADQTLALRHADAADGTVISFRKEPTPLFVPAERQTGIVYRHDESDKIDFNTQRTLPHKFSQAGPGMSVGDINGDGLEDVYIGGAAGRSPQIFWQRQDGSFRGALQPAHPEEDLGTLLFDADGDHDLDLFLVSGSLEFETEKPLYQDRLFVNDGTGRFTWRADALPEMPASGSCARAADFDRDGDLDLLVAGRVVPGGYPLVPETYLLQNNGGRFTHVTPTLAPELLHAGMITDALWTDVDADGWMDIMVVGEFMPITIFRNNGKGLRKMEASALEKYSGWWNSITGADFDKDGDTDYIAGNLGLNNYYQVSAQYPLKLFAKDIDGNGSVDPVLACYFKTSMATDEKKLYPMHFWDELNSQSPKFRRKFSGYKKFGNATLEEVLTAEERQGGMVLEANYMATSYLENVGGGQFKVVALPPLAQVAPVNGMVVCDVNHDGNDDVLMVGNDYGNEVFAGRYDAFRGLVLQGNGMGGFTLLTPAETGFYVPGDAKALIRVAGVKGDVYIATQNRDSARVFMPKEPVRDFVFQPEPMDAWAEFVFSTGKKQRVEFYYGGGYLSQSSRRVTVPQGVTDITVFTFRGLSRKVQRKPVL